MEKENEPHTHALYRYAWANNIAVYSPYMHADGTMTHVRFEKHHRTEQGYAHIPRVAHGQATPMAKLRDYGKNMVILVPLLAFDRSGFRLGYGKGYYDSFLAMCPEAISMGLSLSSPLAHIPSVHAKDMRMTLCLTPHATYLFTPPSQKSMPQGNSRRHSDIEGTFLPLLRNIEKPIGILGGGRRNSLYFVSQTKRQMRLRRQRMGMQGGGLAHGFHGAYIKPFFFECMQRLVDMGKIGPPHMLRSAQCGFMNVSMRGFGSNSAQKKRLHRKCIAGSKNNAYIQRTTDIV